MIQPGKETNPVFPIRPSAGSMPNLSNVLQTPVAFGIDGVTISFSIVIGLLVLFMVWQLFLKKGR